MARAAILGPCGQVVPPFTPHAISVSLPTWRDTVGYEENEKRVVESMETGYPRFFIHKLIQKVASIVEKKFGTQEERCILCPSKKIAEYCREFIIRRSEQPVQARIVEFIVCPEDSASADTSLSCLTLHIVLFSADTFPIAKQFWQHSGLGISSRMAERCLQMLKHPTNDATIRPPVQSRLPSKPHNRHYSVKSPTSPPRTPLNTVSAKTEDKGVEDMASYLEERYGRNLPLGYAASAKSALRRRIAGVLVHDQDTVGPLDSKQRPLAGGDEAILGPSSRGVEGVTEDDVFLFPCGMAAIWSAHQLALKSRPPKKSVCFGFPYTDTLKILEKWGPGCHFFGHGLDSDIDALEKMLEESSPKHTPDSEPPLLALFTEFPSNPLLRSPNLPRLRALADKYKFLIVVDETIGNFVNVSVLPFADIVVSSLTKVFSGDSNVMGGSLVLNPRGKFHASLKATLHRIYEDTYFDEDAIFMERNSRDFKKRVHVINRNTEAVCDLLKSRQHPAGVVKEVFYPKYTTRSNFDMCRASDLPEGAPAFGGLFSVTFIDDEASRAFFDGLACHKGPSLGTNFTLACPYTVLAHYAELSWAGSYGVEEGLVRVSVGTEELSHLTKVFEEALATAEKAMQAKRTI